MSYPEDICRGYHGGNRESDDANADTHALKEKCREAIYEHIRGHGWAGATCEHVEHALGLRHQTCSARISELKRDGRLIPSGRRAATSSGSAAAVLITKDFSEEQAQIVTWA